MPDLTEYLEASAAFTKATGVEVEHGFEFVECSSPHWRTRHATPAGHGYFVSASQATDRDLSAWAWRQLEGIAMNTNEHGIDGIRIGPLGGHVAIGGANGSLIASGPDLASAVLAATKKIGGLA